MVVMLLPGIGVTYNGEEIGMEDGEVTYEQGQDVSACKNETSFDQVSRDFERTPFHWDNSTAAGFSNTTDTWLPVSEKYKENNLAAQSVQGVASHYHIYQDLLKLRQQEPFVNGDLNIKAVSDKTLAFTRSLEGSDTYVFVFNIGDAAETLNLTSAFDEVAPYVELSVVSTNSLLTAG